MTGLFILRVGCLSDFRLYEAFDMVVEWLTTFCDPDYLCITVGGWGYVMTMLGWQLTRAAPSFSCVIYTPTAHSMLLLQSPITH